MLMKKGKPSKMRVKKNRLLIVMTTILALLSFSFPLSAYVRLLMISSAAILGISKIVLSKSRAIRWYLSGYILFVVWAGLSIVWTVSKIGYNEQIFNMLNAIMLNIAVMSYIIYEKESFEDIREWLFPILLFYLVQSIFIGSFDWEGRFSPGGATNQFGITTSYVFLLTLYDIRYKKKTKKILSIIIMILAMCLTILTGSRKALLNLIMFICIVLVFPKYDKNFLRNLAKIILVIGLAAVALFIIMKVDVIYNIVGKRIVTLISYYSGDLTEDMSALRREYMKEDAIQLFKEHPLCGIGLNGYKYVARYNTYAHSNYYEMLACLGLIGTVLYYIPVVMLLAISIYQWIKGKKDAVVPFCIALSFFVNEFSNISYIYRNIHLFIGIATGLSMNEHMKNFKNKYADS